MTTTTVTKTITPAAAKALLKSSPGNRKLSPLFVDMYARDMVAGNWRTTHQGLLLGKDNILIDGHHRLHAVIKANKAQTFMVTTDPDVLSPLDLPIDKNNKRSDSYTLAKSHTLIAIGKIAAVTVCNLRVLSPTEVASWVAIVEPYYNTLTADGGMGALRGLTTAPYYLAGITRLMEGHSASEVVRIHQNLVKSRLTDMSPRTASLYKQIIVDHKAMTHKEFYAKSYRVFDTKKQHLAKMSLKDIDAAYDEAQQATIKAFDAATK